MHGIGRFLVSTLVAVGSLTPFAGCPAESSEVPSPQEAPPSSPAKAGAQSSADPQAGPDPLPIIPGAAGFGMGTPAGSGRHLDPPHTRVIRVTNLNPAGPGSFREAIEAKGPRVVVFEVSGNIDFTPFEGLHITEPYLTIAGQTAPSPGITLKGCELNIRADDVLVQHIRIRVGDYRDPDTPLKNAKGWTQWSERDNLKVGGHRVVIDHCSFSWSTDENAQSTGCNLTFRHNLFSEALASPKHHKGHHSKGLIILNQGRKRGRQTGKDVAVIGNLFAFVADRTPQVGGAARVAVVNNYAYGVTMKPQIGITLAEHPKHGSVTASLIGNTFELVKYPLRYVARGPTPGKVYLDDFRVIDHRDGQIESHVLQDPWHCPRVMMFETWGREKCNPFAAKVDQPPVVVPGLAIKPSDQVRDWVLANAGARPADRGPVDARVIGYVRSRSGGGIPRSQQDVGGWPELAENRRELTVPDNPQGDDDGDGYTNLEEWLHDFAAEVEKGG